MLRGCLEIKIGFSVNTSWACPEVVYLLTKLTFNALGACAQNVGCSFRSGSRTCPEVANYGKTVRRGTLGCSTTIFMDVPQPFLKNKGI